MYFSSVITSSFESSLEKAPASFAFFLLSRFESSEGNFANLGTNRQSKLQIQRNDLRAIHVVGVCNFQMSFDVCFATSNLPGLRKWPICSICLLKKENVSS